MSIKIQTIIDTLDIYHGFQEKLAQCREKIVESDAWDDSTGVDYWKNTMEETKLKLNKFLNSDLEECRILDIIA